MRARIPNSKFLLPNFATRSMRSLRQLARAERHGSRELTARELTSIAALRRRNLDQIQAAIDFLRGEIGRGDGMRVQARRRRRERQQNQREASSGPELHTTHQGKSNTRGFFEEFLRLAVCQITEQSAVLRSVRQSSYSMYDPIARLGLMFDILSIKVF